MTRGPMAERGPVRSPLLSGFPGIEHGFGTRQSLPPSGLISLTQIHSGKVVIVEDHGVPPGTRGDALVTKAATIAVGIATADCVPLLLYDPERRIVAAVHAGWRGIVKGIVGHTLGVMTEAFGVSPRDLAAGIGPAIGPCSYEVGEDVITAFRGAFPWWKKVITAGGTGGKSRLDLQASVALALEDRGLNPDKVDRIATCTYCVPQFHSFRRDGKNCGRQISYIRLRSCLL